VFLRDRLVRLRVREADLDDAVHDVLLSIWKSLPTYDPAHPAGLDAWLVRIAQRYSLQHRAKAARKNARFVPITDSWVTTADPSTRVDVCAEQREYAEELLRALSEERRTVLLAYDVYGMTLDEIAVALSIPRGTVASRLRRARADLAAAQVRMAAAQRRRGFCALFLDRRSLGARTDGGASSSSLMWPCRSGRSRRPGTLFRLSGRLLARIAAATLVPCLATSLLAPDVPARVLGAASLIFAAWKPSVCGLGGATATSTARAILPESHRVSTALAVPDADVGAGSATPRTGAAGAPVISLAARPSVLAPRKAADLEAHERRMVEETRAAAGQGDVARVVGSLGLRAQRFPGGSFERQAEALRATRAR
jgi:RNA polymerase sigma-70 factor, ECF subfamily